MIIDEGAYLEHYGVKGMRWGQRKSYVKSGREKTGKLNERANEIIRESRLASTPQGRKAAANKYQREVIAKIRQPAFKEAFKAANTTTKGETVANSLIFGPIGFMQVRRLNDPARLQREYEVQLVAANEILREMRR